MSWWKECFETTDEALEFIGAYKKLKYNYLNVYRYNFYQKEVRVRYHRLQRQLARFIGMDSVKSLEKRFKENDDVSAEEIRMMINSEQNKKKKEAVDNSDREDR